MSIKIGRNQPCPCGSGKKFKHCCGSNQATSVDTSAGALLHIPTEHMLMNRVQREGTKIAEGFDALTHDHLKRIERFYGSAATITYCGLENSKRAKDDLRLALSILLTNALKSFTAAFALLRTGWRLQPFICLRNGYEAISVALHLAQRNEELERYKTGKLDSTRTISSAKALLPFFGALYGDLSKQFTHIGEPFRHVQLGVAYTKEETDLWHCLAHLAFFAWFVYQVAEYIFYESVEDHHFWKRVGERQYKTQLSEQMHRERKLLVEEYRYLLAVEPKNHQPTVGADEDVVQK